MTSFVMVFTRTRHDCLGGLDEFMAQMRLPRGSLMRYVDSEGDSIVAVVELPTGEALPACAERFLVEAVDA